MFIELILNDESFEGHVEVGIKSNTFKLESVPSAQIKTYEPDEAIDRGFYLLTSKPNQASQKFEVYAGESKDLVTRIKRHLLDEKKVFEQAIIMYDVAGEMSGDHAKYIEETLIQFLNTHPNVTCGNGNKGQAPKLKPKHAKYCKDILEKTALVLQTLGYSFMRDWGLDEQTIQAKYAIAEILPTVKASVKVTETPLVDSEVASLSEESSDLKNTVLVAAKEDGFQRAVIQKNCWYEIRIHPSKLSQIKYIAFYRTKPISAITHYAKVKEIKPYQDTGKYILHFEGNAIEIPPLTWKHAVQGSEYINLSEIVNLETGTEQETDFDFNQFPIFEYRFPSRKFTHRKGWIARMKIVDVNQFVLLEGSFVEGNEEYRFKNKYGDFSLSTFLNSKKMYFNPIEHADFLNDQKCYVTKLDLTYFAPSSPIDLAQGASNNGWITWKTASGETLEAVNARLGNPLGRK